MSDIERARNPILRTSERKDFRRCPQRWQWAWRQGLRRRRANPDALWFGTGIHLALEHRYGLPGIERGRNTIGVWRDYVGEEMAYVATLRATAVAPEVEWISALKLGEAMLEEYLSKYGKDDRWYVIKAEQTVQVPIPSRNGLPLVTYAGKLDVTMWDLENERDLWLWDHKTAKSIQTNHLTLDDQAGSYWAIAADALTAAKVIPKGSKLEGIMYNFLRKSMPDDRPRDAEGFTTNKPLKAHYLAALEASAFSRASDVDMAELAKLSIGKLEAMCTGYALAVVGERSKQQPASAFLRYPVYRTARERATQLGRIADEASVMNKMRRRELPIWKNPTNDCSWDCSFFEMCELHEQGADWKEYRDMVYTKQDPYADHRESAGVSEE